ncbi:MAG: TonB-dependent receptor [Wenzhouxiangella sp.]|nr:MAG: TonB-dependent receptor [Wenzhouxiangella sp.]
MDSNTLRKTPLAMAVAMALGTCMISPLYAKQAEEAEQDEDVTGETTEFFVDDRIQVVGVRGSLMRSMDRKRDSIGLVDAITAEDIGKFPDQNLAEALQRIPGISISRTNNEGSEITVRGFGPEFNLVTFNGRSMPTQGGRSFDFGDIASTGITAVEVIKTGRASLPSGGIGATVNIITPKPLENPGMRGALIGKAVHETSASDGDLGNLNRVTPEIAGIYSNTFADNTFGIAITGSYEERDNREEFAAVDSWIPNYGLDGGTVNNNNQRADGIWWHPQDAGYGFADISRTRTNGQLTLQWEPSDRIRMTLDYTYSELEFEADRNSFGVWFANPNVSATVNERGTVTDVTQVGGDYAINVSRDNTVKTNDSLGFNVDFRATDNLFLTLDVHDSSSKLKGGGLGDGRPGSSANLIVGNTFCDWCGFEPFGGPFTATIDEKFASYSSSGIPIWGATFRDTETGEMLDFLRRSDMGSLFGQAFDVRNNNDIFQVQLDGTWTNPGSGAITGLDFGVSHTEQEFVNRNAFSGLLPGGFWLTSAQYWPDEQWEEANFGGLLSDFSGSGDFPLDRYFVRDFASIVNVYESLDCFATGDPLCNDVYWPSWGPEFQDPSGTRGYFWPGPLGNASGAGVKEDINAAYFQLNIQDRVANLPFNARIGLRIEDTETTSTGDEVPAQAVVWVGGDEFVTEFGPPTFVTAKNSNTEFLPSLDFDLTWRHDLISRFSYSRTLARPPIGALSPVRSFVGNPNPQNREASSGNPNLLPYVSDNFDLSLEWYYAPGSYASVAYFRKHVDNFLVGTTVRESFDGLLDPFRGAQAELAREQLAAEGIPVSNANVFARINENLGRPSTTPVRAEPGDPLIEWNVSTTDNAEQGRIWGWEFQLQHMFADTGFGVQANATLVSGDVRVDRNVLDRQFALPGLSDSYNLIGFYENEHISARLAWNWRDEFLAGFDQFDAPVFVEDYGQLDINLSWFATPNLTVFLEGLNVTEETQRVYVRYPEQLIRGNQYGARYNIGARWTF